MALPQKSLPRPWLWLLAGAAAVAVSWPLDNAVDGALNVLNNAPLRDLAWWCSKLGEGWAPALAGMLAAIVFILLNRPGVAAKVLYVLLACELCGLTALVLRVLIGRTRPLADVPQGFYGLWRDGQWIIGQYEFSSFPSGHSATAVGLAAAAWLVHRGWGAVAAVYALAVVWSRVALQCHHLSDVVASTALAIPLAVFFKKSLLPVVERHCNNLSRSRRQTYC